MADTQPGKKTPVYIKDITPFNKTILSTQEKRDRLQAIPRAFRNQGLISKAQLQKLFISNYYKQLLIPLDPRKSDWYIFCKTELVKGVPTIRQTIQTSKSVISTLLVTFGKIRSKEQHQLIMKHASPRTFLNHYHPLQIDIDIIRVIYGLDRDIELIRAVTRQSC
ncbi:hypothetical protein N7540_005768 [Penicillium herquei]|nr:hypothetical protein N7540_005768 [Penicillium herquei]